ncbi:hypothetical protein [Couchioplanes azureus]|uniref:hypothetical protein n=1 Tax=Couchioplanes caeruleus TaxID=56438 RepID=UPI00166F7F26|nr:hypothetical protein [Couchioplanes caeruleus]GGQ70393.1 hypothetical protein GCM10010166_45380 [Couchioplanes caeruleus subsp. azureus]
MAEPGWPLIPREVLPAPVPAVRPRPRRAATPTPAGQQLSVFGVEAVDPSLADLAGLLTGPGRLGRMGGTARVSVRVDAAWRVHVLVGELVGRGLVVNWHPVPEQPRAEPVDEEAGEEEKARTVAFDVVTAYSSRLNGLARSWPPPGAKIFLNGPRLRLWVAAAGAPRPQGYALGLDPDGSLDSAVHDALTRIGLAGTIQAGPAYMIAGRRRLTRLAELIGERPAAAPERLWPGGAAA